MIVALREDSQRVGDLAIGGHRYAAKPIGEVGIEILVKVFMRVEDAGHPAKRTAARRQAQLLRKHVEIAVQVFVGVVELRGVPVRIFTSDELVVRGDTGELRAAKIDIGSQVDSLVAVVKAGLGVRVDADELGKCRIERPAGGVSRRIRGYGRRPTARRKRPQQIQSLFIGFVLSPMNAEPKIECPGRIPLQLTPNCDLVLVAERLAGDSIALPRPTLFRCDREPS